MTTLKTACSRLPRLATSRPLGERSEPSLPAKRPTTPYEIRRRTFLKVYRLPLVRESKKVSDSGFRAVDSGFMVRILDSFSVELGFGIPIVWGIPDSRRKNFRNPDYLSWGARSSVFCRMNELHNLSINF